MDIERLERLALQSQGHNTIIMQPQEALEIVAAVRAARVWARRWKAAAKKWVSSGRHWYAQCVEAEEAADRFEKAMNEAYDRLGKAGVQYMDVVLELAELKAKKKRRK